MLRTRTLWSLGQRSLGTDVVGRGIMPSAISELDAT
jgi:hypothetical protein